MNRLNEYLEAAKNNEEKSIKELIGKDTLNSYGIEQVTVDNETNTLFFSCLPGKKSEKKNAIKKALENTKYKKYNIVIE